MIVKLLLSSACRSKQCDLSEHACRLVDKHARTFFVAHANTVFVRIRDLMSLEHKLRFK